MMHARSQFPRDVPALLLASAKPLQFYLLPLASAMAITPCHQTSVWHNDLCLLGMVLPFSHALSPFKDGFEILHLGDAKGAT
jgi:hypothetical protein